MTELLSPPTPYQVGDAALVRRNDEPAMVTVGDIISRNAGDFASASGLTDVITDVSGLQGDIVTLDTDLSTLENNVPLPFSTMDELVASSAPVVGSRVVAALSSELSIIADAPLTAQDFGTTTPASISSGGEFLSTNDMALPSRAIISSVSARFLGAGSGQVHVLVPESGGQTKTAAIYPYSIGAAGIVTVSINAEFPAGSYVALKRLTGLAVAYDTPGGVIDGYRRWDTASSVAVDDIQPAPVIVATVRLALKVDYRAPASGSLNARITTADATANAADAASSSLADYLGETALAYTETSVFGGVGGTYTTTAANSIDFGPVGTSPGGYLSTVRAVYTSGTASTLVVLDGSDKVIALHDVALATAGTAVWTAGAEFPETYVPAGGRVLVRYRSGFHVRFLSGGSGVGTGGFTQQTTIGAVQQYGITPNTIAVEVTYSTLPRKLSDKIKAEIPDNLIGKTFTDSAGWTLGGAEISGGLLSSLASSSWANYTRPTSYPASWLSRRKCEIRAQVTAASQIFGLGWVRDAAASTSTPAVVVDGVAAKLRLYAWENPATPGAVGAEVTIPWTLNGSSVKLEVTRDRFKTVATLTNLVSGVAVSVTADYEAGTGVGGRARGYPCILFPSTTAGGVKVSRFRMVALRPFPSAKAARVLFLGDSNTEGASIGDADASGSPDHSKAYGYLLEDQREALGAKDVAVIAQGGAKSVELLTAISEAVSLCDKDTHVILCMGTNDVIQGVTQAAWRSNIAGIIAALRTRTSKIHMACLPPMNATTATFNADIAANYFGLDYPAIRFDLALSASNDGATWNPTYDVGDGIHMNTAGQAVAKERLILDAPQVLE